MSEDRVAFGVQTALRLPREIAEGIERHRADLETQAGHGVTYSFAVRSLLRIGLDALRNPPMRRK